MSALPVTQTMTVEEWLALEEANPERSELVGGVAYAMTGGSRRHNMLAGAFYVVLREAALRRGCRAYMSDVKLVIPALKDHGYYPDVMVVCEPAVDDRYEVAPCLLVEILSPSTAGTDRREKSSAYKTIPTLDAHILADPATPRVEVTRRRGERWVTTTYSTGDLFDIDCPGVELSVDELYSTVL